MSFNPTASPFTAGPKPLPFPQPMQPPMLPGMPPPVSSSPFQPMQAFPPAAGFQQAPPPFGPNFAPPTLPQPPVADMFNATQAAPQMPGAPATQTMDPSAGATTSLADTSGSSGGFMSTTFGKVGTAIAVGVPLIWGGERLWNNKGIFGLMIRSTETALKDLAEDAQKELGKLSDDIKPHFESAKTITDHKALETKKEAVDKLISDSQSALKKEKQALPDGPKKAHDDYQDALTKFFDGKIKALKDKTTFEKETELTQAVEAKHTAYETAFADILPKKVTPLQELHAELKTQFKQLEKTVKTQRDAVKDLNRKDDLDTAKKLEAAKKAQEEINKHFTSINSALNKHRTQLESGPADAYKKYVDTHTSFLNDTVEALEKGAKLDADKAKAHSTAMRDARDKFKTVFTEAAGAATPKPEPAVVSKPFSKLNDEAKTFFADIHAKAAAATHPINGEQAKKAAIAAFENGQEHIAQLDEDFKTALDNLISPLKGETVDHSAHAQAQEAFEKKFAPLLHEQAGQRAKTSLQELGKNKLDLQKAIARYDTTSDSLDQAKAESHLLKKPSQENLEACQETYQTAQSAFDKAAAVVSQKKEVVRNLQAKLANKGESAASSSTLPHTLEVASKALETARNQRKDLWHKSQKAKSELETLTQYNTAKDRLAKAEQAHTEAEKHFGNVTEAEGQLLNAHQENEDLRARLATLLPTAS